MGPEYKFLWVNVGGIGSSSDAQIFDCSKLKRRIENGTLRLPPPEPLGPGGPDLLYFLLGEHAFPIMPWGRRVGNNAFGGERHCVNMCSVT